MTAPNESNIRLDVLITRRGLCVSRTQARQAIEAGYVYVQGVVAAKPNMLVDEDAEIAVHGERRRFVSRGGEKLDAALDAFQVEVRDKTCLDIGSSTGGFTDCLLQRGARHVTAIDVGHGQLDPSLAADSRVDHREGINARAIRPEDFPNTFDLAVVDVSFIPLSLILPALYPIIREKGDIICLVKPQFEVGKQALGKGGIVRSEAARQKALNSVRTTAAQLGLNEMGTTQSPLVGGDGNIEYLLWLRA